MNEMCLYPDDPKIVDLADRIRKRFPEECARIGFDNTRCAQWIGKYNGINNKAWDYIPAMDELLVYVEKWANMSGKSFFYIPEKVPYTPKGKSRQVYTIIGDKIFNKDNQEVFPADAPNVGVDRVKIFANLRWLRGEAVIVDHRGSQYMVNRKNQIVSLQTGNLMQWGDENGDRKAILAKKNAIDSLYEDNQVISTADGRSIPVVKGVKIKSPDSIGGNTFEIEEQMNVVDGGLIRGKTYDRNGNALPSEDISGSTLGGINGLQITAPDGTDITYYNSYKKGKTTTVNSNTPSQADIDKSLTQQTIDQIKKTANVKFRSDMDKYLKEHDVKDVQQAIEEQREMQTIREQAIADGTFMKAPNGKPTNLTERQWLQVRTKNFIDWFGDWINDPANASKVVDENGEPLVVYHSNNWDYQHPYSDLNTFELDSRPNRYQVGLSYDDFNNLSKERLSRLLSQNYITFNPDYVVLTKSAHQTKEDREDNLEAALLHAKPYLHKIKQDLNNVVVYSPSVFMNNIVETDAAPEFETDPKYEGITRTYFTTRNNLSYSRQFGENAEAVFLNIKNPFNAETASKEDREKYLRNNDFGTNNIKGFKLKRDGYDGAMDYTSSRPEYVVFNPNQIKSATDNNGMFSTENDDIQMAVESFLKTSEGEVYGFVSPEGEIYLDETVMRPEHGIHEFTHLWDKVMEKTHPEVWKKGVELMKDTQWWKEIEEDPNYGAYWKSKGIKGDKLDSLIASEVHSRITGIEGERLLRERAEAEGADSIYSKLLKWIEEFWKDLKASFSDWSQEEIDRLTLEDFRNMTIRDLAAGHDLTQYLNNGNPIEDTQPGISPSEAEFYSGAAEGSDTVWKNQAKKLGIKTKDYTVESYDALPDNVKATIEKEYREARGFLGKPVLSAGSNGGKLTRRDMMQADKADAIFAIADGITKPGEREKSGDAEYVNTTGHDNVKGGTANAVARGILRGIPVYVYDQSDRQWKVWDNESRSFKVTGEPILTPHAATIGTKKIDNNGVNAISSILRKSVNPEYNQIFDEFKRNIEYLSGYFEGGGRHLSDDVPDIPNNLIDKLGNHFMGGDELTMEDYRDLWRHIEFYGNDRHGYPLFRPRGNNQPSTDVASSEAASAAGNKKSWGPMPDLGPAPMPVAETPKAEKPKRPHSTAFESALNVKDSRIAQFHRTFSAQQIKDRGAMLSDMFSDILDEELNAAIDGEISIINDESRPKEERDNAKVMYGKLTDPLEGRQFMVQTLTVPWIVERILEKLNYYMQDADEEKRILYGNTIEFFEELFNSQASLDIEEREGIRIIDLGLAEQTERDEENEEMEDGNDEVGHYASGSDGWSFQIRYVNPFDSLSKKVKGMMYEVYRPEDEKDDLGNIRKYPMGQIYASFLAYLSKNMFSPDDFMKVVRKGDYGSIEVFRGSLGEFSEDDMDTYYPDGYPTFPVLEKMARIYPWVTQVIDRLTNDYLSPDEYVCFRFPPTGGSLASQFYSNFRKAYIPYAKIQMGTDKFGITPLNYEMEEKMQLDKLIANFNNRMILTPYSIYNPDGKINREHAATLEPWATKLADSISKYEYHTYPEEIARLREEGDDEYANKMEKAFEKFVDDVQTVMQSFGVDASREGVLAYLMMEEGSILSSMLSDLSIIAGKVEKVKDKDVDTFNYLLDVQNNFKKNLVEHLFDGRGLLSDMSYMQSYYDSASRKTKYSYSADNYMMKAFRGIAMGSLEERRRYIDEHYGRFEWFRDQSQPQGKGWRNAWLEFWYNYDKDSNILPYRNIDNISQYHDMDEFGQKKDTDVRPYMKWERSDIWEVQDRSYDSENQGKGKDVAFYLSPIFSDSPMSMTLRGPKMSLPQLVYGYTDDNGVRHQGAFVQLVQQELWRMGYVQRRAQAIREGRVKEINNFDTGVGELFCFIPELNGYTFDDGKTFLEKMMEMKAGGVATNTEIETLQIQAIMDILDTKMKEYINSNSDKYDIDHIDANDMREQYYNMAYANAAIIQLTTVDLAFYGKGRRATANETLSQVMADFQKRFKEVYAGGIEVNTNSRYGVKTENVAIVADDVITSPSYSYIAGVIDGSKTLSASDKKRIKKVFEDINVADAQAIRAMASFRSVLDMMGRWNGSMEKALDNFRNGTWTREDFEVVYQTIKPFMYTVIDRSDGFGGTIAVPQQHKNSEICALMMYDIISQGLGGSPVYKAFSRFMDENTDEEGNPLISMIQYESAGKVGNQGVVNVSWNPSRIRKLIDHDFDVNDKRDKAIMELASRYNFFTASRKRGDNTIEYLPNDDENAIDNFYGKEGVKEQLDNRLKEGEITQKEYNSLIGYLRPTENEIVEMLEKAFLIKEDGNTGINPETVHTIPFENYYQQQPTPEHHIDAEAIFGSQTRNIMPADLPEDFELVLEGKGKEKRKLRGGDEVIDFYYELLDENLIEDFFGKGAKKGLKDIFKTKESFRNAVKEIVRGNPKYGSDFADALEIDNTGNFTLSPNSPTMFQMMQEIVTSLFKNRITKQKIDGASLIQAAGIGLDDKLRVRFDDDGKPVGVECYLPMTARRFFEPLMTTKEINGKDVPVLDPKVLKKAGLDKAIGYRIPTENKSSIMPLIIKGFTPQQNGSSIVLAAEITALSGSDFDVDKMFLMLSSFKIIDYNRGAALKRWGEIRKKSEEIVPFLDRMGFELDDIDLSEAELQEEDRQDFNAWFEEHKDEYLRDKPIIRKVEYDFSKSPKENGRRARNNMVVQMMYKILVSKTGSESLFNPQGFDDVKRAAKINRILSTPSLLSQLLENHNAGIVIPSTESIREDFLKVIKEKDPDNYSKWVRGIDKMSNEEVVDAYIKAKSDPTKAIQMLLESPTKLLQAFIDRYSPAESPLYPQTFMDAHAKNMAGSIQIGIYAVQGSMAAKYQRASITLKKEHRFKLNGREVFALDRPDGGRILKNVGQLIGASADNGKDPNLSDMGSTSKTAPMIGYLLRLGLSHLEATLIMNQPSMKEAGYNYKTLAGSRQLMKVQVDGVTTDMLIRNMIGSGQTTQQEKMQIDALCYRILVQAKAIEYINNVSRADSPNGAMENTYGKARVQRYNVDLMQGKMGQQAFPFNKVAETLSNDAVDTSAPEDVVREQLKAQRMALLHGMYALGINSFNSLMHPYFFGAQQWFDEKVVKPILYNMNEGMTKEQKEEAVDRIYKSYITYVLSGSPLFGNEEEGEKATMKQKRDYYMQTFPADYRKILKENEDINDLLGNILEVLDFGSRERVVLKDMGSINKSQKADIQRRLEALITSDNEKARKLAADLLIYSFFDNGLQFTHDSFSTMFNVRFLTSFDAYTGVLDNLDKEVDDQSIIDNFIVQFLLTYTNYAYKADAALGRDEYNNPVGWSEPDDSTVIVDLTSEDYGKRMRDFFINETLSPNPEDSISVYPYIMHDNRLYILDKGAFDVDPSHPIYHRMQEYATSRDVPLFSIQMTVGEMTENFPKVANAETSAPIGINGSPIEDMNVTDNPDLTGNNMYDAPDTYTGAGDIDLSDIPGYEDISDIPTPKPRSEQYREGGKGKVQDAFC